MKIKYLDFIMYLIGIMGIIVFIIFSKGLGLLILSGSQGFAYGRLYAEVHS